MAYRKVIKSGDVIEIFDYTGFLRSIPLKHTITYDRWLAKKKRSKVSKPRTKRSADRARFNFIRLVQSNISGCLPVLVTLTYRLQNDGSYMRDLKRGFRDYTAFLQKMRYRYGRDFRAVSVPEFTRNGTVHFHCMFWGLPDDIVEKHWSELVLADSWVHGFVFIKYAYDMGGLAFYLTKYLTKTYLDSRLGNHKSYVATRNCLRPEIALDIEDGFEENYDPVSVMKFDTAWLGQCTYKKYELSPGSSLS